MAETVTIIIDGQNYQVPKGMNLVDAAKMHGTAIPVFCYHPKMKPVGMCRMCLVELGGVAVNRESGKPDLDADGQPVIRWQPKLQTACTQIVSEGLAVRTSTAKVVEARDDILEFLLTSHPLDCPVCDKGGECPLQNLTLAYGPGESRFVYDDKQHLAKHVPLGDLIYLDRERCIQCARCVRFCDEIAGDDVLAFHERGRRLQIVTISDPPFNTKFSGNTSDICPVGALTTADFRFGARPWELSEAATICPHCPVGCNLAASTRLDRDSGGKKVIKRLMPRQNEQVNEIWICDKGRFGHHHSLDPQRLSKPLLRKDGEWVEIDWKTAYQQVAEKLQHYGDRAAFLAGPSLANEDLWELRKLARLASRDALTGVWPATMTGLEPITQVGVGVGTRLPDLGSDSVIVVVASDFEEEAPIWWLQVKQAADRGAKVIVVNARPTKLDRYARCVIHCDYGEAPAVLNNFTVVARRSDKLDEALIQARVDGFADLEADLKGKRVPKPHTEATELLLGASNVVIFAGAEGLTLEQHGELMQAAANLLTLTGHVGRANNGLVAVWPGANMQGAFDLGFTAEATVEMFRQTPAMVVIGEADPVAEDPRAAQLLDRAEFVVVSTLFMTPTAEKADLVLPIQSFAEREGTFTNGMRRVQRFYMAQTPLDGTVPAWKVFAHIGAAMPGGEKPRIAPAQVMRDMTQHVLRYAGMDYVDLARVEPQFPNVGGHDLYYGGTAYSNDGGLGIQWATNAEKEKYRLTVRPVKTTHEKHAGLKVVPVQVLYDRDVLFAPSQLMHDHIPAPYAVLNPQDADGVGVADGDTVAISVGEQQVEVTVRVSLQAPAGAVLLPQRLAATPLASGVCTVQKIGE